MRTPRPQIEETILLPSKIEHKGIVYQDKYKKIEKIHAIFDSFTKEFFVSDFGPKAAIMIVRNDHVLLIKQYRLLINGISCEIPGGSVNANEDPADAALRECFEETGLRCSYLTPLISFHPDYEYTKNHTHIFYTEHVSNELKEDKRHAWVPLRDCLDMIFSGEISDCLSIIAIFAYWMKIKQGIK